MEESYAMKVIMTKASYQSFSSHKHRKLSTIPDSGAALSRVGGTEDCTTIDNQDVSKLLLPGGGPVGGMKSA